MTSAVYQWIVAISIRNDWKDNSWQLVSLVSVQKKKIPVPTLTEISIISSYSEGQSKPINNNQTSDTIRGIISALPWEEEKSGMVVSIALFL